MGQTYSVSVPIPITNLQAAVAPIAELISFTSTDRPQIHQIDFSFSYIAAATAALGVGLGFSGASGTAVRPGDMNFLRAENVANLIPSNMAIMTQWLIPPTIPTTYMRKATLQATSSNLAYMSWPFTELVMPPSQSLVLWNIVALTGIIPVKAELTVVLSE